MTLAPRLDLRQSQSLVMTPQLQQAIKLLQLSNLELTAFIEQELESNPLLEREDGREAELTPVEHVLDQRSQADESILDPISADGPVAGQGRLGVAVRSLTAEERQQAGVNGGVVVENASGAAAGAGIQRGDVILSVNNTPVKTGEQLRELIQKAGKRVALLVQREDAKIYVPIELG